MIQKIVDEVMTAEAQKSRENVTGAGITGWRSSGLGTCMRGRFLNRLLSGTGIKPEVDARTLRVFEMGNQVEDWLMKKLVQSPEYNVTQQIEMYDPELNLSGHLDAYLVRKEKLGDEKDEYIVECKSKHSKAFWYMDKKGEGAQTHHKMQLHSYLYMLNKYGGNIINPVDGSVTSKIDSRGGHLKEGALLYVSKDDMALLEYPVKADDVEIEKMWKFEIETLNKCWNDKTAPPAPEKGSWQEKYCEFCKIGLCETLTDAKVKELFTVREEPIVPVAKFKVGEAVKVVEGASAASKDLNGQHWQVQEVYDNYLKSGGGMGQFTYKLNDPMQSVVWEAELELSDAVLISSGWTGGAFTTSLDTAEVELVKYGELFAKGDKVTLEMPEGIIYGEVIEVLDDNNYGVRFDGESFLSRIEGARLKYLK